MLHNTLSSTKAIKLLENRDSLAELRFTNSANADEPTIDTRVQLLGVPTGEFEVWTVEGDTIESGQDEHCSWRRSKHLQMTSICAPLSQGDDFEAVAFHVYQALLKCIDASPQKELVRFWNYIPNINHGAGDSENYKRFCTGRLAAFNDFGLENAQFPAASAVGHYGEGITIYALSASVAGTHHANPRQLDAFKYPRQYGPSSPSFARATTLSIEQQRLCFISGTASILGHSSVNCGNLRLQLHTTNDNILHLLKGTDFTRGDIRTLRVYLRNIDDYDECKEVVEQLFPDTTIIYTHADICRADLLVEIECFCVAD